LQAAYIEEGEDAGVSSLPPANLRTKTWQAGFQQKRYQRHLVIAFALFLFLFIVPLTTILMTRNKRASNAAAVTAVTESIMFR
jgi:hypothetical protein